MDNETKILITSDIHLGMGDSGLVPESERIGTFRQIAAMAREHDILLIAGDLIDSGDVPDSTKDIIKQEFAEIREAGTEIIYAPGIGEQNKKGELHEFLNDFGATHIFVHKEITPCSLTIGEQKFHIYGAAPSPGLNLTKVQKTNEDGFHIGLFHHNFNFKKTKPDTPMFDLDFYALGYGHSYKVFKVLDRIVGAKPGSPLAITEKETGERYVISMKIQKDARIEIERFPVNTVSIVNLAVNCGNYSRAEELNKALMQKASPKNILVVNVSGEYSFLPIETIESLREHFFDIRATDTSTPSIGFTANLYEKEDTIKGEFCRILKEKLLQKETMPYLPQAIRLIIDGEPEALEEWLCGS
ncbi:MAG: metallophosphoesterase [Leptospirales bacterium]|nr:metallophosphoesterase [Leptospirales bacterium]